MDFRLTTTVTAANPIEGDLELSNGALVWTDQTDAIAQDIRVRLRWFRGEWFIDRRTGFPWFERVLGHKIRSRIAESLLRRAILSTPGVTAIREMTVSVVDRRLYTMFTVQTTSGRVLSFKDFVLEGA